MPPSAAAGRSRLLVIKLSSLGDVVQALPVATALRRHDRGVRLAWAVEDWIAPLLHGHPAIDRLIVFPAMRWARPRRAWIEAFRSAVHELRQEPYDVAIDLQGLAKSSLVSLLSRAPRRIGYARQREGAWLVSHPVRHRAEAHIVDQYLACAEALGASPAAPGFDLPVDAGARTRVNELLAAAGIYGGVPIVINSSAARTRKRWPVERWGEVADGIADAGDLILVGTSADSSRNAEIARRTRARCHDLSGRTTLAEVVALLQRCALHLAHDTGTAHIAAALGRPVVSIFGPTDPQRYGPYGQAERALRRAGQCARTCPQLCPYRRRCLGAVTTAEVVRTSLGVLGAESAAERRNGAIG